MEVYIHLGIHKTGSSFLQKEFFPKYEGELCFLDRSKLSQFKAYVLNADDFEFDANKAMGFFKDALGENFDRERVVVSDEEFYGNPYMASIDRKRNFDRLFAIFGNTLNCVVFLRNQQSLLNSLYNQYVKTGGTASFDKFLSYKKYPLNFSLSYLIYDKYISYLKKVLKDDRIKVYLYEDFLENKLETLNDLNYFITNNQKEFSLTVDPNRKVNSSLKNGNIPLLRLINKLTSSPKEPFLLLSLNFHKIIRRVFLRLNFSFGKPRKYVLISSIDTKRISDSNKRLKSICPELDLSKHGYLIRS
ncbi:hypothetical protein [uncultured Winogradskyella sp.]|uniref:hypothetical protein n=1 Tax=uncultured Winogradskyella sp. TaxID=395353 RepID=UPI0026073ABE|nr:hypothetical protein [uncultured Winogradskyella sp.]